MMCLLGNVISGPDDRIERIILPFLPSSIRSMASKNSQQSLSLIKMAMCGQAWAFKATHASLPPAEKRFEPTTNKPIVCLK
jgi:hypothetical protein